MADPTTNPLPDELNKPLSSKPKAVRKSKVKLPRISLAKLFYGLSALIGAGFIGVITFVKDPMGGQPFVVSTIVRERAVEAVVETPNTAVKQTDTQNTAQPRKNTATATDLETEAGVIVVRSGGESAPNSVVIKVSEPVAIKLNPSPDQRISERSRYGTLPKIGANGAKAMEIYARPVTTTLSSGQQPMGRIAIVVGGLGISPNVTQDAIARLMPAITLAFAPYGADLERYVARARDDGHEVMLQIPMEPFDYPDSDPGPHTLTVTAKPQENSDKLQWVMGRFSGYVGVMNYMGAKITADKTALQPIVREIGQRGLFLIDDGTSPRSNAVSVAQGEQTPAAKAEVVIDAVARGDVIDKELARLETLAREKGVVIANASALPITIERLSKWSQSLESKGILLIPVSAAVSSDAALLTGTTRPKR